MSSGVWRISLFVALTVGAIACGVNHLVDGNPAAPCTFKAAAHILPGDTTVIEGGAAFTESASVSDCNGVGVIDIYSWSSSDTTVILVDSLGTVFAVGPGNAYAIITGQSEGRVGAAHIFVGAAAAASRRRP